MYTTEFIKLQNSLVCVYIILAVSRSYACYGSPNYNIYLFRWAYALAHGTSKPHNFIRVPFDKSEMKNIYLILILSEPARRESAEGEEEKMKDVQGIQRGKCNSCKCIEYRAPEDSGKYRCDYCNHTPGEHVEILELGACKTCGKSGCDRYSSEEPNSYTDCQYCGCPASQHEGSDARKFVHLPLSSLLHLLIYYSTIFMPPILRSL